MDNTTYYLHNGYEIAVMKHYSRSHKSVTFITVVTKGNTSEIVNATSNIPVSNINLVIDASQCAVMSGVVYTDNQNK